MVGWVYDFWSSFCLSRYLRFVSYRFLFGHAFCICIWQSVWWNTLCIERIKLYQVMSDDCICTCFCRRLKAFSLILVLTSCFSLIDRSEQRRYCHSLDLQQSNATEFVMHWVYFEYTRRDTSANEYLMKSNPEIFRFFVNKCLHHMLHTLK